MNEAVRHRLTLGNLVLCPLEAMAEAEVPGTMGVAVVFEPGGDVRVHPLAEDPVLLHQRFRQFFALCLEEPTLLRQMCGLEVPTSER